MTSFIIVIHVIVCVALILIVLLQTGKGASLGAAFGGATQAVFGPTGSAGFFEKVTTGVAIIFMVTSLSLTYISAKSGEETVMTSPVAQEERLPSNLPKTPNPAESQKSDSSNIPKTSPSGDEGAKQ
jgi:preprotein translocase subunit SecG